ncbi:hypothetical protein [Nitrobacter sp. TKz-YC02]|uniref:hypothetical protein n=1 Tax=Nitrobacter sp. TKz-YC02 TaxID=3398704 RepID=UPI003CEFFE4C
MSNDKWERVSLENDLPAPSRIACAAKTINSCAKRRVLGLSQLQLEWRGQDAQSETEQSDHFASLGDFNGRAVHRGNNSAAISRLSGTPQPASCPANQNCSLAKHYDNCSELNRFVGI